MGGIIIPIFLVIVSVGLFFTVIDPQYAKVEELRAEQERLEGALASARELRETRESLLARYNTFPKNDLDRLQKFLPDHIDNVRLILDIDTIAAAHGLIIRDFGFTNAVTAPESAAPTLAEAVNQEVPTQPTGALDPYGSVLMEFSTSASYEVFSAFLRDLERSLRVVDVVSVSVEPSESGGHDITMTIRAYWLR